MNPSPDILAAIEKAASAHGVSVKLLTELARYESDHFSPDVIAGTRNSPTGAKGLFQFTGPTAKDYNVNPLDPASASDGAARYMRKLLDQFDGSEALAIAAWNQGPGSVASAIKRAGSTALDAVLHAMDSVSVKKTTPAGVPYDFPDAKQAAGLISRVLGVVNPFGATTAEAKVPASATAKASAVAAAVPASSSVGLSLTGLAVTGAALVAWYLLKRWLRDD